MEKTDLYKACFVVPILVIVLSFAYLKYELGKSEEVVEIAQVEFEMDQD